MIERLTRDEEEALLGRPVESLLTPADRNTFAGRVCLITGAGGSVGAELARQIAACRPARLILIDHSELALFRLEQELTESAPAVVLEPILCDVTRASVVMRTFRRVRPEFVFHAAAYKHVTMAERAICAAARINVLGTEAVLTAAQEVGARFVLISSDKAAEPRSVMGATKRFAEIVALANAHPMSRAIVVRFGNVLASSGSFVETMADRIRAGQPLLITDPNATRFFMTVAEAASLVMKATRMARGGETFWLDMGEPIRIGDLAGRLLLASAERGLPPVPIRIVGLRPGEKMSEQLTAQGVRLARTKHPRVWVAHQAAGVSSCASWLKALRRAIARDDARGALNVLITAVRDFVPSTHAWEMARMSESPAPPASLSTDPMRASRERRRSGRDRAVLSPMKAGPGRSQPAAVLSMRRRPDVFG